MIRYTESGYEIHYPDTQDGLQAALNDLGDNKDGLVLGQPGWIYRYTAGSRVILAEKVKPTASSPPSDSEPPTT